MLSLLDTISPAALTAFTAAATNGAIKVQPAPRAVPPAPRPARAWDGQSARAPGQPPRGTRLDQTV